MWDLIIFGTGFWFWTVIALFVVVELAFAWNDLVVGSIITFVVGFLVFLVFAAETFNPFSYIHNHPIEFLIRCAIYLGIGICWSIFKWWWLLNKWKVGYNEIKAKFLEINKIEGKIIPPDQREKFKNYLRDKNNEWNYLYRYDPGSFPGVSDHKEDIVHWIMFWPFSLIFMILGDFLCDLCKYLVDKIDFIYRGIRNHIFKEINKDFQD